MKNGTALQQPPANGAINSQALCAERRARTFSSGLAQIVCFSDGEGCFTERQQQWEMFTGQPLAEASGFGWTGALDPGENGSLSGLKECFQFPLPFASQ